MVYSKVCLLQEKCSHVEGILHNFVNKGAWRRREGGVGWVAIHGDGVGVGLITEVSGFFIIFLYLYQRTNDPDFIGWGFHSEAGSHILLDSLSFRTLFATTCRFTSALYERKTSRELCGL